MQPCRFLACARARSRESTFVAERSGVHIGFVAASLCEWAEGCRTTPVGYIESWWVDERFPRRGVGRALFRAAEKWARSHGCAEISSDVFTDNTVSHAPHRALGYREIQRVVSYAKNL